MEKIFSSKICSCGDNEILKDIIDAILDLHKFKEVNPFTLDKLKEWKKEND